jgi:hypothetical protein
MTVTTKEELDWQSALHMFTADIQLDSLIAVLRTESIDLGRGICD